MDLKNATQFLSKDDLNIFFATNLVFWEKYLVTKNITSTLCWTVFKCWNFLVKGHTSISVTFLSFIFMFNLFFFIFLLKFWSSRKENLLVEVGGQLLREIVQSISVIIPSLSPPSTTLSTLRHCPRIYVNMIIPLYPLRLAPYSPILSSYYPLDLTKKY